MTSLVIAVVALAAINVSFKAVGPALLAGRSLPPRLAALATALSPALLSALLVVDLLGPRWRSATWTVAPGLAAAVGLRQLGRSHLTCIAAAVAVTALVRAVAG